MNTLFIVSLYSLLVTVRASANASSTELPCRACNSVQRRRPTACQMPACDCCGSLAAVVQKLRDIFIT